MGWQKAVAAGGTFDVRTEDPVGPRNPHYLRITSEDAAHRFGVSNEGFRGIGVEQGDHYTACRRPPPYGRGRVRSVRSAGYERNDELGVRQVDSHRIDVGVLRGPFVATRLKRADRSRCIVDGAGAIDVDMVSLFPDDTWKNRENGLRADLGAAPQGHASRLLPLPRRLHCRGPIPGRALSMEEDDRRAVGSAAASSTAGTTSSWTACAGLLPIVRPGLLRVLPAGRRYRSRAAADSQLRHGLPVQLQ